MDISVKNADTNGPQEQKNLFSVHFANQHHGKQKERDLFLLWGKNKINSFQSKTPKQTL